MGPLPYGTIALVWRLPYGTCMASALWHLCGLWPMWYIQWHISTILKVINQENTKENTVPKKTRKDSDHLSLSLQMYEHVVGMCLCSGTF